MLVYLRAFSMCISDSLLIDFFFLSFALFGNNVVTVQIVVLPKPFNAFYLFTHTQEWSLPYGRMHNGLLGKCKPHDVILSCYLWHRVEIWLSLVPYFHKHFRSWHIIYFYLFKYFYLSLHFITYIFHLYVHIRHHF